MTSRHEAVQASVRADRGPQLLRFGHGNAKLSPYITTFSLVAGYTCPFARDCLSRADQKTGHIKDGKKTVFRCYAASMEARHSSVRRSRWHNFELLRRCESRAAMVRLILDSLSLLAGVVRVHDSGDYWCRDYFDAWVEVARERPRSVFYCYSKSLPYWVSRLGVVGDGYEAGKLSNLVLTASWGGAHDHLITKHRLRSARVVFSQAEADELGLEVDHDDSHAMRHGPDFALLVHGTQPKGSPAAEAVRALRDAGWSGYGARSRIPLVSFEPAVSAELPR